MASVDASDADYLHDVFLAHATADNAVCLKLYEALEKAGAHVFMDVKGLDGAAEWDLEIPLHQKQSRLTLVFVSEKTPAAWFQRAEIARAITQRRFGNRAHAVLPIWGAGHYRPYGLETLTGLAWQDDAAGIDAVVQGALEVLQNRCGVVVADRFLSTRLPPFLTTGLLRRPGPESSPVQLLVASRQVVAFGGRADELATLDEWADRPGISMRLLHGVGGAGKTRLALEWLRRRRDQGDLAGLLNGAASALVARQLLEKSLGTTSIVAIDYAESRRGLSELVVPVVEAWDQQRGNLKVLLMARQSSDWWSKLREDGAARSLLDDVPPIELALPLGTSPEAEYQRARRDFAELLGKQLSPGSTLLAELGDARALFIHIAALLDVLGRTERSPDRLLDGLLERERQFWRKQAGGDVDWPEREEAFEQLFAALTLRGGARTREDLKAWLPTLGGRHATAFLRLLEEHYEGTAELWRAPVEPDLVGEHLVWVALRGGSKPAGPQPGAGLVERAMQTPGAPWSTAFTVLARAEPQHPDDVGHWLDELLVRDPAARALPAVDGVLAAGSRTAHGQLGTRLSRVLEKEKSISLAAQISERIPEQTVMLRELAVWANRVLFEAAESLEERARCANNLGIGLSDLGKREEALQAMQEAVGLRRELAKGRPDAFLPDLAMSLNNLGIGLSDLGKREEALQAMQEAVGLRRELAKGRPDAFLPALAGSLNNLGNRLSELGKREEALQAMQEAVGLRRELAKARPDAFLPDLAGSLNNLGIGLSELGKREEALQAIQEAVGVYRELAKGRSDAFLPALASSLNNLGIGLSELGKREEALQAMQEAVAIRRGLARQLPQVFIPRLLASLRFAADLLAELGRSDEAEAATREADALEGRRDV